MRAIACLAALALGFAFVVPAAASDHVVRMLDVAPDGERNVYEPAFLRIEPGESVTFLPASPHHNTQSIEGMLPEGAERWQGRLGEPLTVVLTVEGLYGYKCLPDYGMGMAGLIQVGSSLANEDEARAVRHPGRAGLRMERLLQKVDAAPPG